MYLRCDLDTFDLKASLGEEHKFLLVYNLLNNWNVIFVILDQKFDVILIEPPLVKYFVTSVYIIRSYYNLLLKNLC